jgi:hypothetical protein
MRHAEANRRVVHNVAVLVDTPKGHPAGRAITGEKTRSQVRALLPLG